MQVYSQICFNASCKLIILINHFLWNWTNNPKFGTCNTQKNMEKRCLSLKQTWWKNWKKNLQVLVNMKRFHVYMNNKGNLCSCCLSYQFVSYIWKCHSQIDAWFNVNVVFVSIVMKCFHDIILLHFPFGTCKMRLTLAMSFKFWA